jgi:hypothetical protein
MPKTDYNKYLVKQPFQAKSVPPVKNQTSPPLVYMSNVLVPEVKYYIEFSWVWGMPEPNPPTTGHVYDNDVILLHIGGDCYHPEDLGAEIEYIVGGQILRTRTTGALFVPRGTRHGVIGWKNYKKPHVMMTVILGAGITQESNSETMSRKTGIDYERNLVRKPAYEVIAGTPVKNRQGPSSMTLMSNTLVPGCNIYIEGGWVWGLPDPNPHIFEHVHDYEELVMHFGTNYRNPEELGGEIEFCVGGQPLMVDKTSAIFVPAGVRHGPLTWKKYSAPHLEMAIMPGAGTLAEADPGGHQEKMKRRKNDNG